MIAGRKADSIGSSSLRLILDSSGRRRNNGETDERSWGLLDEPSTSATSASTTEETRHPRTPARLCKFPDLDYPLFSGSFSPIVSSAVFDLTSFSCPTCST